jgi:hypothetical protein
MRVLYSTVQFALLLYFASVTVVLNFLVLSVAVELRQIHLQVVGASSIRKRGCECGRGMQQFTPTRPHYSTIPDAWLWPLSRSLM